MKLARAVLIAALVVAFAADATPSGTVCIAPVEASNARPKTLGNPNGGARNFNFTIRIGDRPAIKTPKKGTRIEGLALNKRHRVVISREGKPIASFWFTFEGRGSRNLCLVFKGLYETWVLSPCSCSR